MKRRAKRRTGLTRDAKALDVCYQHLSAVLGGRRESESLRKRYDELKKRQLASEAPKAAQRISSPARVLKEAA